MLSGMPGEAVQHYVKELSEEADMISLFQCLGREKRLRNKINHTPLVNNQEVAPSSSQSRVEDVIKLPFTSNG